MIGKIISRYQIIEKLGQGGMGEVFLAHDTSLDRRVALKFLPDIFSGDPERLARFELEAKLLASLNHPAIATIYGFEQADGKRFLAMELAEGETLAQVIDRGPLPVDQALEVCRQIANGLEAAHEKGVIHRDLKPGNVNITPEGKVKVLDFGLAKAFQEESAADQSHSPTITEALTRAGVILGTAGYMSPEQAKGKPVDKRTDIWAFGCVLYECLTGRMSFSGETISDTIALILTREPDWTALPANTPPNIRTLLGRCLKKDLTQRLHDIADARLELEAPAGADVDPALAPTSPVRHRHSWIPWALSGVLAVALVAALVWLPRWPLGKTYAPVPVTRFAITLPPGQQLRAYPSAIAISPDGHELVFDVIDDGGQPGLAGSTGMLYRRRLDELAPRPIAGTETGEYPFFSPDGESVGFITWNEGRLKKVSLRGGAPQDLSAGGINVFGGGTWTEDDRIVYSHDMALMRVSADGGTPERLLRREQLNPQKGELRFGVPRALPGTAGLLLAAEGFDPNQSTISIFAGGQRQMLPLLGINPAYLTTGHLLYIRPAQGDWFDVFAVPFDLSRLRVAGKPAPVLERVRNGALAVSDNGTLAYASSAAGGVFTQPTWVDLQGRREPLQDKPAPGPASFLGPRVSPDMTRLLFWGGTSSADGKIYVLDLATHATRILTSAAHWWATWTPDSRRIIFIHQPPGEKAGNLFSKAADGSGPEDRLTTSDHHQQPLFVTPDSRFVVYQEDAPEDGYNLWKLPLQGERTPTPLLRTKHNERLASLSKNGRFMAYVSDESGREEVWVCRFPEGDGATQVSNTGGTGPLWAPDGRTLYYRSQMGTRLYAVPVIWDPALAFGQPTTRDGSWLDETPYGRNYDITPDGKSLVMIAFRSTAGNEVTVVLNWFEELKRLVPTGKK